MRWTLLGVGFWACGSPPEETTDEPEVEEEPEGECVLGCFAEPDETCDRCATKIAKCCYAGRDDLRPLVKNAMLTCEADPACGACCNECAARSCAKLIESGGCPTVL